MLGLFSKLRAAAGLATVQLRYYRLRTILAVLAITLAVLSTTLLASVGYGVLETGTQKFEASHQDFWITRGPIRFAPGTVGGFENTIVNSHQVSQRAASVKGVAVSAPITLQTVYVGTEQSNLQTMVSVGVQNVGTSRIQLRSGSGFSIGDVHYAGGNYTGNMTYEIIVDPRIASKYNVSVGDTLYVGGTISSARHHRFEIVGISPTFSNFLGTPTVILHQSELQEVTGTTGTDPATMIAVRIKEGANPSLIERELEREFPEYRVQTNRERFRSLLGQQSLIIASAGTLVVLAVLTGIVLTANILTLIIYQQRVELAVLKAGGMSSWTLVSVVIGQAMLLGVAGGALGIGATPMFVEVLNTIAVRVVGFENVLQTPDWVLGVGFAIALGISVISAAISGWQVVRITPLKQLQR